MTFAAALAEADPVIAATARKLSPSERDDLTQVGRAAAWLAWGRFDGTGDVVIWMCAKAKWAMIDHLRACGPYRRRGDGVAAASLDAVDVDGATLGDFLIDPGPGPEQTVCDRDDLAATVAWLHGLPPRTADAVTLPRREWADRYDRTPGRASQIRQAAIRARAA